MVRRLFHPIVIGDTPSRRDLPGFAVKGTWIRFGPMFVYKNYLTLQSNKILTESHPKCTNHFGKD